MKITIKTALLLLTYLMASGNLAAQPEVSLQQCREMALKHSENLQIADKTLEKAQAEKAAARSWYLPSVSGSATLVYLQKDFSADMYLPTYTPNLTTGELEPNLYIHPDLGMPVTGADGNPVFNMYAYMPVALSLKGAYLAGINLEQALFTGGKIKAANQMAKLGETMAQTNRELVQLNTILEVDQIYWLFVSVSEKVKIAELAVQLLDSLVQRVNNSYNTGMVQYNELLKVQVQYNQAVLDLQKANSGLSLTRMGLCRIIGLPLNTPLVATDTTIVCTPKLISEMGSEDVSQLPEYRLMDKQVKLNEEQIKLARADFLPTLGLSAGYSKIGGIEFSGSELANNNLSLIGSLKIPLFHWGEGKNKIASAKINRDMTALEMQKNKQLLQLQIEQSGLNLQDAFLRIEMAETALKQADENLRLSKNNYAAGAELMTDLLLAQTHWQQAHSQLIEAKTDYKFKETQYLKAIGKIPE
jgi:outer membrane protein TolC